MLLASCRPGFLDRSGKEIYAAVAKRYEKPHCVAGRAIHTICHQSGMERNACRGEARVFWPRERFPSQAEFIGALVMGVYTILAWLRPPLLAVPLLHWTAKWWSARLT